jgi:delta14-sterol reductase
VITPAIVYLVTFLCNDVSGCPVPSILHPKSLTLTKLKEETNWPANGVSGLVSLHATVAIVGYYFVSLLLLKLLPGVECQGVELKTGGKLWYKLNGMIAIISAIRIGPLTLIGFNSVMLILLVALLGTVVQGPDFPLWTFIWDNYIQIITTNLVIAFALAVFVYVRSFSVKPGNPDRRELAAGGRTGNIVYDFFIGRELNPRVHMPVFGEIDIKSFCEMRPGMMGWLLLDLAFAVRQYKVHGYVSDSMVLLTLFQGLYVLDALYMEPAVLTTMDIIRDGFGFMLAVGDLVWVPFFYSLQARYLSVYPVHLGVAGVLGVLAVQGLGYYIFRSANNQKNIFRTDPNDPRVAHLKSMPTASGRRLLISGWWGTARHINYLGDWIMGWSYCLPTGIAGYVVKQRSLGGSYPEVIQGEARGWGLVITYLYLLYFAILTIHRERRDDAKCQEQYGRDWEEYQKLVPSRIVPGIY